VCFFVAGVNDKIRAERERRNISQEELAKRLGLSKSVVQIWEYGRGLPAKESLKKISQVFRKPVSFFTGNPEDDEAPLVAELEWDTSPVVGRASMVADGAQVQAYGSVREPGPEEVRKALADLEAALDDMEAAKSRAKLAQLETGLAPGFYRGRSPQRNPLARF